MGCALCTNNVSSSTVFVVGEGDEMGKENLQILPNHVLSSANSFKKEKESTEGTDSLVPLEQMLQKDISDFFPSIAMLKEINKARKDPLSLIKKIEYLKQNISYIDNKPILSFGKNSQNVTIKLNKGPEVFDNCISFLKNHSDKSLPPLIMKEELKIPFPVQSPKTCADKDYLKNIILFKTAEVSNKIRIIDFYYDICIPNTEISTLLQIIDDTNSNFQRRKNIFNERARYIGIVDGKVTQNLSCFYLMFAE